MITNDTIAAIATPIGTAGIGVIRMSGASALEIAARIFRSHNPITTDFPSHTARYGTVISSITSDPIDDAVLTFFRGPKSYTGEDVVEISCHGSIAVLKAVLSAVLDAGARIAEPGEFTRRAFLNGKMDLAQAEAVNDLIHARTDGARKIALSQLEGTLSDTIRIANNRILGMIAAVEAAIDFPDDVPEPEPQWLMDEASAARELLLGLLSSFGRGRIYREGLRVVIAGKVNVGKSSLLNALLRHARAIVTPIPGTTRDVIEESLEIRGIPVVAIDTAGLRPTDDPVEKIGIERTRESMDSADIVLLVADVSDGLDIADLRESIDPSTPSIIVLNKIDLLSNHAEDLEKRLSSLNIPAVRTSAASGQGIDELEDLIASLAASNGMGGEGVMVSNIRHQRSIESACESLAHTIETIKSSQPIDFLSVDLLAARNSLGLITGETAEEDLLDRIFSEFCIGK
ncbi:MAG: tRNA uridine-5-carboxymethylaminomethyl(34) synthesis GTPase MnmE [Armatimonadota bacterium]